MQIRIRYLVRDETIFRVLDLTSEEYFDPLAEGEAYSIRSVPKYAEAYEFIGSRAEELNWTVLTITDGLAFWRVRTQFLDGLRSVMHHSQESDGSEELIHQTEIIPNCWHTIRTLRESGKTWTVVMNGLSRGDSELGIQDFCGHWTFNDRKGFGEVI